MTHQYILGLNEAQNDSDLQLLMKSTSIDLNFPGKYSTVGKVCVVIIRIVLISRRNISFFYRLNIADFISSDKFTISRFLIDNKTVWFLFRFMKKNFLKLTDKSK